MGASLARIANRTPAPYVGKSGKIELPSRSKGVSRQAQLDAYGAVSTLFAIVSRLANTTAGYEWQLWRKAASGRREDRTLVGTHPALDLLNRPSKFYTRAELFETAQQHVDLTGEGWIVVARNRGIPMELWPVRPDRMAPVKDPREFIAGYVYTDPDGKPVPLGTDEVMMMRMPSPTDAYRGAGPVQTLLVDLEGAQLAAEWNRNFFKNSAEPGGVIEFEDRLDDEEYETLVRRWRDQHKGVANAHRVAIVERGKWVDRKYTNRDMEFTSLRGLSSEIIRQAFGFPKPLLGDVDDVNRAVAEAMDVIFARWLIVPRLDRWKGLLNNDFLPMYPGSEDLEFDYPDDVVPADRTADNEELRVKSEVTVAMIAAGFSADEVLEWLELPSLTYEKPAPPAPPVRAVATVDAETDEDVPRAIAARAPRAVVGGDWDWMRNAVEDVDGIDLSEVEDDYQEVLNQLMADWTTVTAEQREAAVAAVRDAIDDDDLVALASIELPWELGAGLLGAAMALIALRAAVQVQREAGRQGVSPEDIPPRTPSGNVLAEVAKVTAQLLARSMASSAAREALRVRAPGASGTEVADRVDAHLRSLTDAQPRESLGGALTGAQNMGRIETLHNGPVGAIYASEQLDKNTCKPCKNVHGRWLGNTDDLKMVDATYPSGAYGGYIDCLGGSRCRGTVVGVWRPKTTGGSS